MAKNEKETQNQIPIEQFYPDIKPVFKKILINYIIISFDGCKYIETVAMGKNEDNEEFKIFYHFFNPYSYKNYNVNDVLIFEKKLNVEKNPLAVYSSMMLMKNLSRPSGYLRLINENEILEEFKRYNKFLNNFFKQPYIIEEVITKPSLIKLDFRMDLMFQKLFFQFIYVSKSKNISNEILELKRYLENAYPNISNFYDIIEFKVYNKVPTSENDLNFIVKQINLRF